ncbi:transposable element Tcb2 transposase [Trichonephila clavipes]|nr:transposable element Tcb2 transposase [Trichonephila clavipes]
MKLDRSGMEPGHLSDESRFNLSFDDNHVRVWKPRGECLNSAFALQRHTAPTAGLMIWGVIALNTWSSLVLIRRTKTAQQNVHDILQPRVLPLMQRLPGTIFQHNARPCMARVSQECLCTVTTLPWPSRSPDISPSEHIWDGELGLLQGVFPYNSFDDIKYLDLVIDETLRMYPPVARIERVMQKNLKLKNTCRYIPKGAHVTIPICGIHRDPFYENPEEFDPSRSYQMNSIVETSEKDGNLDECTHHGEVVVIFEKNKIYSEKFQDV